jgi:hypothetical protein
VDAVMTEPDCMLSRGNLQMGMGRIRREWKTARKELMGDGPGPGDSESSDPPERPPGEHI